MTSLNEQSFIFRPVREDDLDEIFKIADEAKDPITTLPNDRDYLRGRIHESLKSFYPVIESPGSESYFFVLESYPAGEILGCSAIFARVGGYEPFYAYEIRESHFNHKPLNITKTISELHLKLDHDGPTEIGSLYLKESARGKGLGPLLSLARFLFIAQFSERFSEEIIAELRGVSDQDSESPFWNAVGRHFFDCDYLTADLHTAKNNKSFLRDLMGRHPIYLPMLPQEAQDCVGEVHPNTRPALKMLVEQGFEFSNEVDIFDAGPAYRAKTSQISSIAQTQKTHVSETQLSPSRNSTRALLSRTDLDFRCLSSEIQILDDGSVSVSQATLEALALSIGDPVAYLSL